MMEHMIFAIKSNFHKEVIFILEHNHIYTFGTSGSKNEILDETINVINSGRGGKTTYHGPGQIIMYPVINIKDRHILPREYLHTLCEWIEAVCRDYDLQIEKKNNEIGVWVKDTNHSTKKIASIGIRVRNGIAYHGIAINWQTNLDMYNKISPCGLSSSIMTSMESMGIKTTRTELIHRIKAYCPF